MGQIRPLFVYFRSFHMTNIVQIDYNEKSVDGVLGTWTRGGRMLGPDKSTQLWRHPYSMAVWLVGKCCLNNFPMCRYPTRIKLSVCRYSLPLTILVGIVPCIQVDNVFRISPNTASPSRNCVWNVFLPWQKCVVYLPTRMVLWNTHSNPITS